MKQHRIAGLSMINKLPQFLDRLKNQLPGFLAAAVVNADDGLSLAELSLKPEVDAAAASAYLASIVKSNSKAIRLLAEDQVTDDIIVSTDHYHFIIRDQPGSPFFLFVMTERDEWLGRTKLIMNAFARELEGIMSI